MYREREISARAVNPQTGGYCNNVFNQYTRSVFVDINQLFAVFTNKSGNKIKVNFFWGGGGIDV